jgi:hypothetical protein
VDQRRSERERTGAPGVEACKRHATATKIFTLAAVSPIDRDFTSNHHPIDVESDPRRSSRSRTARLSA